MGYVIQEGALVPHLTAAEIVALIARDQGWTEDAIARRVDALAQLAHFPQELLTRYPAQLSGGQRQRVALMRALVLDPAVLLFDEPLGALDPMIRAKLQDELASLFKTLQKTVLFVTHDLAEAAYVANEIVLMREGHVVQRGTAEDLRERPAEPFVSEFVRAQR
jgi:osmoprotectant transport system ATP-binding protein